MGNLVMINTRCSMIWTNHQRKKVGVWKYRIMVEKLKVNPMRKSKLLKSLTILMSRNGSKSGLKSKLGNFYCFCIICTFYNLLHYQKKIRGDFFLKKKKKKKKKK